MYRRNLLALAVSLAALAATAAPAGATPVAPDTHPDQIIAVLIGLQGLKLETEVTDYLKSRTASGSGLDKHVFSGDAYDNEMGITTRSQR